MAGSRTNPNPALVLTKLIGTLVVAGVLGAGVLLPFVGGLGLAAKHQADRFLTTQCNLQESPPPQKTEVLASDGKTVIATLFTQDRQPVPLSQIPTSLQQALVATEDRRFYSHHGVDMRGLIRSAISTSSGDTQGGSTLTMQYVKQIRYYQAGSDPKKQAEAIAQNINRKIEDAKCALYFEGVKHESKATILDNYLNIAFFGENSYGIQTAAETYFDKPASQLTLPESAMLVGLLRAPTQYDPFQHPEAARERRDEVLQNLVDVGDLPQARADRLKSTPVSLATTAPPQVREGCANSLSTVSNVGFFCDYAVNWLLDSKAVTPSQLQTGGLKIVTTLDANLQNSMQARLTKKLSTRADMSAIMPVIDPHTGDILAMATSKHYGSGPGETTLPIFTSYTAQGASTYKLFPLLAALATGVPSDWLLQTPQAGVPYTWKFCAQDANGDVQNGDANETFNSNESLRSATAKSSNTFFAGVADQLFGCDLQPILDMAAKLGMKSLSQQSQGEGMTVGQSISRYGSAKRLVLGDIATSPLELTAAYAAIADEGRYNAPSPIKSVTDSQGQPIGVPRTPGHQVVNKQVARQAVDILSGDTKTPGTSAVPFESWYATHSSIIAGKTGTATGIDPKTHLDDKNGALWFVGMTPTLVATTALINLDHPSAPASGLPGITDPADRAFGAYASGIWLDALQPTLAKESWTWPSPDAVSGDLVPDVSGQTLDEARSTLKLAGYSMSVYDRADGLICASKYNYGSVAFYAPQIAPRGTSITVCPSSGTPQDVYVYIPPPPPPPPSNPAPGPGAGSGSGSGSGGGAPTSGGGGGTSGGGGGTGGGGGGGGGATPPGHGGGTPPGHGGTG